MQGTMFRRIAPDLLVNLKHIASIQLHKNTIIYTQNTHMWSFIFFAGGTDKDRITITYPTEADAVATYKALCKDIAPPKEKPLA
jgi:hypothetical protein